MAIPDSFGTSSPEEFSALIAMLMNRVPNIDQVAIAVHCHDDLGLAVENSLAALASGAKQIECSINGLGARKGNADLEKVVSAIAQCPNYKVDIDTSLLSAASACLRSAIFRAIFEAPIIFPVSSLIGETLIETSINVPSFLSLFVS